MVYRNIIVPVAMLIMMVFSSYGQLSMEVGFMDLNTAFPRLKALLSELPTDGPVPNVKVPDGMRVVGVLPPALRPLFWAILAQGEKRNRFVAEHRTTHGTLDHSLRQCLDHEIRMFGSRRDQELLTAVFGNELFGVFDNADLSDLGVYEGWQVAGKVISPIVMFREFLMGNPTANPLANLFEGLFGKDFLR